MKTIKIDDNYYIDREDSYNFILRYRENKVITKGGEEKEVLSENNYYYPNVSGCLKKYLDITQTNAKDVKDCIQVTQECYEKISKLKFN
jgi:hypothetical protein